MRKLPFVLVVVMLSVTFGFAQKVKVGYDKSVDFSKYKSYTWQEPGTESRPFLYATVAGSIRSELEAKGLARMEKDGDLTVIAIGAVGYGLSGCGNDRRLLSELPETPCRSPGMDWKNRAAGCLGRTSSRGNSRVATRRSGEQQGGLERDGDAEI